MYFHEYLRIITIFLNNQIVCDEKKFKNSEFYSFFEKTDGEETYILCKNFK